MNNYKNIAHQSRKVLSWWNNACGPEMNNYCSIYSAKFPLKLVKFTLKQTGKLDLIMTVVLCFKPEDIQEDVYCKSDWMGVSPDKAILAHNGWDKCKKTQCYLYHKALIHIYASSLTHQIAYFLHYTGGPWDQRTLSLAGKFMKTQNSKQFEEHCLPWRSQWNNVLLICFLSSNSNRALIVR